MADDADDSFGAVASITPRAYTGVAHVRDALNILGLQEDTTGGVLLQAAGMPAIETKGSNSNAHDDDLSAAAPSTRASRARSFSALRSSSDLSAAAPSTGASHARPFASFSARASSERSRAPPSDSFPRAASHRESMTPSETYLHPNDAGVAKHIVSNAVAHSNPEKARAAIRRRYSKAYEFEKGQTDSVGHAVFGAGSAIRSADAFDHSPPEQESIKRQGILSKRIVAKEISWCERYITLTTEKIYIRNEKDGDIRDELSLLDITHVHKCASSVRPRKSSILPLALQLKREESLHAPGSPLEENYLARMATGSDTRRQGGKLQNRVRALIHSKRFASDLMTERPERTSSVDSYDAVEVSVEDCGMVVSPAAENEDLPRSGSREPSPGPSFAATGSSGKRGWRHLQWQNCFEIYIQQLGRMYYFRAGDDAECDSWITDIRQAVQEAEEALHESLNLSRTQRLRIQVQTIYDTDKTQMFTSLILLINFVFSISQTELDLKESSATAALFDIIEMCFTGIYVVELLANIFGHWFRPFISSAWNWFDLIIVCLSIFDAAYVLSGGSGKGLNVLRLLRIFRIFRIFNKLDNMRRIMLAILGAMGPVLNAFLLFAVVISIYAVVGVNLFAKHGHHAFSSFSLSFYTLLGIAAGEDWTMWMLDYLQKADGGVDAVVAIYFVSFIGLVAIVVFNIIVGVLIEAFISSMSQDDSSKRTAAEAKEHHRNAGAMDPLLATLANFTSPQHLTSQIELIFCLWDVDDSGSIDFEAMRTGLQNLGYEPSIMLSSEDWDAFTHHGLFLDDDQQMKKETFELAMRFQLDEYSQRLLANKMLQSVRNENEFAPVLFAMKMAFLEIMAAAADRRQDRVERLTEKHRACHPLPAAAEEPGIANPVRTDTASANRLEGSEQGRRTSQGKMASREGPHEGQRLLEQRVQALEDWAAALDSSIESRAQDLAKTLEKQQQDAVAQVLEAHRVLLADIAKLIDK